MFMALALSACGGVVSDRGAPPMQHNDKTLTCEELLLEINDARFILTQAEQNKGLNFRNIIWPVGYPQTYSSAEEAIDASAKRIQYLSNIYAIKKCDQTYPLKR
jgi:hypothetical protein